MSVGIRELRRRIDVLRINDRTLTTAGPLLPADLRLLDAIHLATAQQFGAQLARLVTYDDRLSKAAQSLGWAVAVPA